MTVRTFEAKLERTIDGDTVVLRIDLGFRMTATLPIRLLGIDCPERGTLAGSMASEFTRKWFFDHPRVKVETHKDPEKFGRWLGRVMGTDGDDLAEGLFMAGHAVHYDGGRRGTA